jgi:hypothetical protein
MAALKIFLAKYGLATRVPLILTVVLVLFTAIPAMGQMEEFIRNGKSPSPFFAPTLLLLISIGAQVLIAAGLGIYFLRRFFYSGSLQSPGHLPHSEQRGNRSTGTHQSITDPEGRQVGQTGVCKPAGWAEDYSACSLE